MGDASPERRRPMSAGKVLLIVLATGGLITFGGCAALLVAIGHIQLNLNFGAIKLGGATKEELAEAATTVPPTHDVCLRYARVASAGDVVGKPTTTSTSTTGRRGPRNS